MSDVVAYDGTSPLPAKRWCPHGAEVKALHVEASAMPLLATGPGG